MQTDIISIKIEKTNMEDITMMIGNMFQEKIGMH